MTRPRRPRTAAPRERRRKVRGELAPGIAHEIGNMLGALQLRLQILQENSVCRKAQGRNLEAMARILEQANDLVQRSQVLALSAPLTIAARTRRRSRSAR